MAWTDFDYTPSDGLSNTTSFPSKPSSGPAARSQFMTLFNQIKAFLNGTVKSELAAKANSTDIPETLMTTDNAQTMTAVLKAKTGTDYDTAQVRNIILSTEEPGEEDMGEGEIWIQYEE
jgi:hypothetical protein